MTLLRPAEPAWIATLDPPQRRMVRAFFAAKRRASSFSAGPAGVTPGAAGVYQSRGLDLRSYALVTEVIPDGGGLPASVRLTSGTDVNTPASLFSTPNGRVFTMRRGFGFGSLFWRMSAPVTPMRGAVFVGWGTIGVGTLPTAAATGFGYDLGRGDTAQWYAQTRAASTGPAATRIPLGSFGMVLTGAETYSHFILVERAVRVAHVVIVRHDAATDVAWGHGFTDADGLPDDDVLGYVEPFATSGGDELDGALVPRTTVFPEVRGFRWDDFTTDAPMPVA